MLTKAQPRRTNLNIILGLAPSWTFESVAGIVATEVLQQVSFFLYCCSASRELFARTRSWWLNSFNLENYLPLGNEWTYCWPPKLNSVPERSCLHFFQFNQKCWISHVFDIDDVKVKIVLIQQCGMYLSTALNWILLDKKLGYFNCKPKFRASNPGSNRYPWAGFDSNS